MSRRTPALRIAARLLLVGLLGLPGAVRASPCDGVAPEALALLDSITLRLGYMRDVALAKARSGNAVENREREAVVLASAVAAAQRAGLDGDSARAFFAAQIAAAKAIQYRWLADWTSDAAALQAEPRDLNSVVRPALLALGDRIVATLAAALAEPGASLALPQACFDARVAVAQLSPRDQRQLAAALAAVRRAATPERPTPASPR